MLTNDVALALVGPIAPDAGLVSVQQVGQHRRVVHIGGRRHHGVDELALAVHADMRLHPEIPLVPLPGLAHLRVAFLRRILGRTRGVDDGRIGVVSVLAYVSTVEDPERFTRSRSVGAHMGLTPRQYQSGEIDRSGRISRCGDTLARTLMYEAAVVILTRVKRASNLKDWAQAIAKRSGLGKARVALARKLSVILHSIWRSGEAFRWSEQPAGS